VPCSARSSRSSSRAASTRSVARARRSGTALLIAAILAVGVAAWGGGLVRQWVAFGVIGALVADLREAAFAAVLAQGRAFFDARTTGDLVSRIVADAQAFANLLKLALDLCGQVLLLLFLMGVLLTIDLRLTLVTASLAALIVAVTRAFRALARRRAGDQQRALAALTAQLQESLGGIAVIRNFHREGALRADFARANARWFDAARRLNLLLSGIFPFMLTVVGLGTVAVIFVGGRAVLAGTLTPGEWYLFAQSVALFWSPLTSLASSWGQVQQGFASGERLFALLDAPPTVAQAGAQPPPRLAGRIELQRVTFRYGAGAPALDALDLRIAAGETVALVGHTGAGKTSVARLIAREYEFEAGQILVDGRDIRTLDLDAYRARLGIVPQTPYLFSGTVAENIRYGRPDAPDDAVLAAARRVAGGDWLAGLPQGLDSPVGELGRGLAAGQRQLVALARVFLQDPAILILDEATASLDPITEALVQEGFAALVRGRTAIVIAHRLPTVRHADRIVVMREGQMLEQGTHDALLRNDGHYRELYERYFRYQAPEDDDAGSDE